MFFLNQLPIRLNHGVIDGAEGEALPPSKAESARSARQLLKSCGRRGESTVEKNSASLSEIRWLHVYDPTNWSPCENRLFTWTPARCKWSCRAAGRP